MRIKFPQAWLIRHEIRVFENLFGFMPGRSTIEINFLLWRLMKKYRENKKDLHMVFFDLEKAYDRVSSEIIRWVLDKNGVLSRSIDLVKDMYDGAITSVRTIGGETSEFTITVDLHQGLALSPYLFALVMDELTKRIQEEVLWCMLFVDID